MLGRVDDRHVLGDLADDRLQFVLGGFELPVPGGGAPVLVRAFNVLRQYDEASAARAWDTMRAALGPGGLIVEGTCVEACTVTGMTGTPASAAIRTAPVLIAFTVNDWLMVASGNTPTSSPARNAFTASW